MKYLLILLLFCTSNLFAAEKIDLEATMKKTAFTYKKAMQATDINTLTLHVIELKKLIELCKKAKFSPDKKAISIEGFNKVLKHIKAVNKLISANQFDKAKLELKQIDLLRKQYHKHHKPSFWQLIFG